MDCEHGKETALHLLGKKVISKGRVFLPAKPFTGERQGIIRTYNEAIEETYIGIPEYNYLDCEVESGEMKFLGNKIKLPPAIDCPDGKGELLIPVNAVKFDVEIKAEATGCENINGKLLVSLNVNGGRLYAISNKAIDNGTVNISLDFKKLIIKSGAKEIQPMPEVNGLNGTFAADKITERIEGKNKKITRYYLNINGAKFEAPAEIYGKMFAAATGRKVYNSTYRYEWTPYDFKTADKGIEAQVLETLDYGYEKFIKCKAGEEILYVFNGNTVNGTVYLVPSVSKVSVIESERQIRIV